MLSILRLCRRKSRYVFDEFYRYFPCSSEYAVNGYFKYLFKAWFTDSDCCVESVFLGIRRKNYESGDNVIKGTGFCGATQNLGASNFRVIIKHIIPNILGPVIVAASLSVANAILMESSLSFLGLGVQIPRASWGSMLQGAQAHILDYPLLAVYPGVMILITVLSFNLLGDILRNALEPKIVE